VKKLQNVSGQNSVEKAVDILLSEPVCKYLLPFFDQYKGDLSAIIAHRSSIGFQVKKILDMYDIDWPEDPFDLYRVRALSEMFKRLRYNESDTSKHS
jgi:hypothetical protein